MRDFLWQAGGTFVAAVLVSWWRIRAARRRRSRLSQGATVVAAARLGLRLEKLRGGRLAISSSRVVWVRRRTTVDLAVEDSGVSITAQVRTADRTGVEMEALTSVSVAALTLIDMIKSVDKEAVITDVRLESKDGGKSGSWRRA